ncbi:MAG: hypothetical protein ABW166_17455 [Sedimenticola sp.]
MKSTVILPTRHARLLAIALLVLLSYPAHAANNLGRGSGTWIHDTPGAVYDEVNIATGTRNKTTFTVNADLTSNTANIAMGTYSEATIHLNDVWTVDGKVTMAHSNGHGIININAGGQLRATGNITHGNTSSVTLTLDNGTIGDNDPSYTYFSDTSFYTAERSWAKPVTLTMLNNSKWYADEYTLNGGVDVNLTVSSGSLLHTHHASLGGGADSNVTATLDGHGTKWKLQGYEDDLSYTRGDMTLGDAGTVNLAVTGGADIVSGTVLLAVQSGSTGNVRLEGSGTTWTLYDGLEFGDGSADFAVRDGAVVNAVSGVSLSSGAMDSFNSFSIGGLDSGDDSAATVNITSTFNLGRGGKIGMQLFEGGVLNTSGFVLLGADGGDATVHLGDSGTLWDSNGALLFGGGDSGGTSSMLVTEGAVLDSTDVYMASTPGDDASLTMIDSAIWRLGGKAYIGSHDSAKVLITSGSELQGDGQDLFLGSVSSNAAGTVIVAGDNAGTESSFHSENLYIGGSASADGGMGTLRIGDNPYSSAVVETGGNVNVDGTLKLWSGGSVDMMSGSLEVGTLDIREGLFSMDGGTLMTADVLGDLRIQGGTFRPGHSPAVTTITGHYTQDADGILEIELAGLAEGEFDLLNISGVANLSGTLEVTLLDDYLPEEGDLFTFLTAATILDTFDYLILPDLAGQTEWKLIYGSDSVSLGVVSAVPLPAAVWLFGAGLLSLIGFSKRKKAA